jgi:hypothetical protein
MPSNAATTSHFPWTKLATFWKVSKYHKRKKSQQHLSFMEKHFNNSLLQLTFAVNQDFMSESITPKHSRSIRNQLHLFSWSPVGWTQGDKKVKTKLLCLHGKLCMLLTELHCETVLNKTNSDKTKSIHPHEKCKCLEISINLTHNHFASFEI